MAKLIYLEPDEEITDVIDKISKTDSKSVSLVIPRGSTLANSIVNLKLLVKRSKALKKDVALVTNDNIAHNLASQIGLDVYESIEDAKVGIVEPEEPKEKPPAAKKPSEPEEIDGVQVHQYDKGDMDELPKEDAEGEESVEDEPATEPEVIEAVRDADTDEFESEEAPEEETDNEKLETRSESPKPEKDDFKLVRKPMAEKPKQRESFDHLGANNNQVFGRMRGERNRKKIIMTWVFGSLAVLLLIGAYIALPKATVTLSVVSEPFSSSTELTVEKDHEGIDQEGAIIPGTLASKEDELTKPFAATGTKNIGAKASGKVTLYNYWDDKTHEIASGTKLVSSGNIAFVTKSTVTIPAGHANIIPPSTYEINPPGTVDVNVEAADVGEQANIGASNFTIPSLSSVQQSKIYGKSTSSMSGGTNNMVKVVSDQDISDAKTSTENELKDKILEEIKADLGSDQRLLDSAIAVSVTSENASAKSGDQTDNFNYVAKVKIDALYFSENDFKTVLLYKANKDLPEEKMIVSNSDEGVKYEVVSADVAAGTIKLKGSFDGYIASKYDQEKIKSDIRFKSNTKATSILTAYPGVLSADISETPSFLRSLPVLTNRISIEFNFGQ